MPYPHRSFRDLLSEEERNGNVLRFKQPIKLGDYGNLVDIGLKNYLPIDDPRGELEGKAPETEIRAFARYLHSLPENPIGIIENPVSNRPDIPVVVNIWPNAEKTYRSMGIRDKAELVDKMGSFQTNKIRPVILPKDKAPCKDVIITEDKVDLRHDIPRIWVEFNKLCFTGCNGTIISYDPNTNTHGLTKTRLGVFDWDNGDPNQPFPEERVRRYGFATMARPGRPGQGNTGRYYFNEYRAKDKPWPTAFVYGLPTDVHVLAAIKSLRWPETGDEYDILGGLRGEPVELVESETIPGLMVPAEAEWVIEGEFISEDYVTPEYSEDVGVGMIWGQAIWPVFKVKCITHRQQPLWTATTFSSLGSKDHQGVHLGLFDVSSQASALYTLRNMGHRVKDVTTLGMWFVVIQLEVDGRDKPHPGYGEEIGKILAGKYTVVVGPDIDPNDPEEVLWAIGMRAGRSEWRDYPQPPSGTPPIPRYGMMNKITMDLGFMVIDATIPVPERFDSFPPRSEPPAWENEAIERMKRRLFENPGSTSQ